MPKVFHIGLWTDNTLEHTLSLHIVFIKAYQVSYSKLYHIAN